MGFPVRKPPSANEAWLRALERSAAASERPELTLPVLVNETAARAPEAPALVSTRESFNYRTLSMRANAYANWARAQHIGRGDVVGLLMSNRPEYVAIWLGVTAAGGTVALLNTNLTGAALTHSLAAAGAATMIVEAELCGQLQTALSDSPSQMAAWAHGATGLDWPRIDTWVEDRSQSVPRNAPWPIVNQSDRALYIYTSGTTGMPKAASIGHHRIMQWSQWFAGMADLQPSDRTYNCLPLYHSVGGIVAVGAALAAGGSVFVRDRFSASQFWDDVAAWDCTVFQYIGELCRYLLHAPHDTKSTYHKLRLACGNGLKADIWMPFKSRFAIPQILEFYAATEGNFSLFNCEEQVGSIGRVPKFLSHRHGVSIIKVDQETGEPVRDSNRRCLRCGPEEIGEAVARMSNDGGEAGARFEGYADPAATERKILRDAFAPGDAWFRSGDLMRKDDKGFHYFVDRIGDTFRWKGENVSSTEVAGVVRACPGVLDADVYGVDVPGADGKAGMAAIVVDGTFDIAALHRQVAKHLPSYARPLFVRIRRGLVRTATFKANKQQLQHDGFDPARIGDPLYFDADRAGFTPLDVALFEQLARGTIRL